jgi:hypothetical protein
MPITAALYERKLTLIRPDGHVAWRADSAPDDPLELIDLVRGAPSESAASRARNVSSARRKNFG